MFTLAKLTFFCDPVNASCNHVSFTDSVLQCSSEQINMSMYIRRVLVRLLTLDCCGIIFSSICLVAATKRLSLIRFEDCVFVSFFTLNIGVIFKEVALSSRWYTETFLIFSVNKMRVSNDSFSLSNNSFISWLE